MTAGQIIALAAVIIFALVAVPAAYALVKLGRVFDEAGRMVAGVTERTVPLLGEVTTTVTGVNGQLERVDAVTANVQSMTTNVNALTGLFSATLGGPVVKVAAFTYGVRKAASGRARKDAERKVREQMKADRASARADRAAS